MASSSSRSFPDQPQACGLLARLEAAVSAGCALLPQAYAQLQAWLSTPGLPAWVTLAIDQLVQAQAWEELNERFHGTLQLGTGGLRGRTLGRQVAPIEQQGPYPAVGSCCLNDLTVAQTTLGLYRYVQAHVAGAGQVPGLVIAHDVRFFSAHFCQCVAQVWMALGGQAWVFDGPRSTPELSFATRALGAHAGVVITASHNPPSDNGYKVYGPDGAQLIPPEADRLLEAVAQVSLRQALEALEALQAHPGQDRLHAVPQAVLAAYTDVLREGLFDPSVFSRTPLKLVYSPLHGTGQVVAVPLFEALGIHLCRLPSQEAMDPRFATVASPNPENPEAFQQALALAKTQGADLVLATDPDADRMGVAVPGADGQWRCLTGNTISCLLAQYTLERLKASGALPPQGHPRARIITTFVTTPLLQRIAQAHGVPCVKTLTGFKWIAGKMRAYEQQLAQYQQQQGLPCLYDALPLAQRRQALLQNATCFLYGTEESYGYLVSDRVRDKDAHGAMLLFCELVASLKEQGRSVEDYLQQLYLQHGYFLEDQINLYYEGVQGAARIKAILDSYRVSPPVSVGGVAVTDFQSLEQDLPLDADGQRPLHQALFLVTLASGAHYAVRGSGTEPKLKLYLFVHTAVDDAALPQAMARAQSQMTELKAAVMHETQARAPAGGG